MNCKAGRARNRIALRSVGRRLLGRRALRVAWVLACMQAAAAPLCAQDLDVVLYEGDRPEAGVIDRVGDPRERAAFQALESATDPASKRALADEFLAEYPQSWLLSFAHSMAAMACIELDDLEAGLAHGERSLRIAPENGALLAVLANVQAHMGLLEEARRSASDALEHLDRFRRPSTYTDEEWSRVRSNLEGTAHYVLGRVAATRGMRADGPQRADLLGAARASLRRSVRLNGRDGIAAFLLGTVSEELGLSAEARSAYAAAAGIPGPVRSRALESLRAVHRSAAGAPESFQQYRDETPPLLAAVAEDRPEPQDPPGDYAGSRACADCHRQIFDAWSRTGMAQMFRTYAPANVIGDFEDGNEFRGPDGAPLARMGVEGGRHYFELPAGDGTRRFPVDYTIGSKWQQAYASRLPDGRIHVVPLQYNRLHGQWVNFWEVLDDGPSERSSVADFHRMQDSTNYQLRCAPCHTSQVQAEGGMLEPERITFRETGINCEMCHGPSRAHVEMLRAGRPDPAGTGATPLRFGSLDHREYVRICGQCHMQSSIVELGPRGEVNYSGKRSAFAGERQQHPYEEFSSSAFYKDGRFRETTFIVESFVRSQCYREGAAHCGHCHDPHPADSATNPTSLKFRENPDRMCVQCHPSYSGDAAAAHTRHAPESEASRCASCHMPKIMNSMMFLAGTHRIDDVPDAAMTARFGREDSPNACLACHADRSDSWLAATLAAW